jgi:hypothetical protein
MSAIVATAKLRSARRDRSHPFVDGLAFILICARVSMSDRSDDDTCPPIFRLRCSRNPIWPADRGSLRMSKSSRIWFTIFAEAPPLACLSFANRMAARGHLMKAAEEPDEKDDRDRYADQPKQKTSTHNFLLLVASQPNVGSELKFHARSQPQCTLANQVNKGRRSAYLSDEERCPNSARVVLERHAPHTGSRHSAAPGFTVSEKDGQSRDRANPAESWRLRRDLNQ